MEFRSIFLQNRKETKAMKGQFFLFLHLLIPLFPKNLQRPLLPQFSNLPQSLCKKETSSKNMVRGLEHLVPGIISFSLCSDASYSKNELSVSTLFISSISFALTSCWLLSDFHPMQSHGPSWLVL